MTEDEAQQLRERMKETKRSAAEARRETAAMAAEDETSIRWRAAVAAEKAIELSRHEMAAIARAALSRWSNMRSAMFSQAQWGTQKPGDIEDECETEILALLSLPSRDDSAVRDGLLERIKIACDALDRCVQGADEMRRSYGDIDEALVFQTTGEMRQGILEGLAG